MRPKGLESSVVFTFWVASEFNSCSDCRFRDRELENIWDVNNRVVTIQIDSTTVTLKFKDEDEHSHEKL